jgi:peptidoglycan L-alanyl-D-glutamate endopeptidase CwlK
MYQLGNKSKDKLKGVHPTLVRVIERAIELSSQDFMVLEGLRTPERQAELYAQGRTKPGQVVTWTLKSRHFVQADGWGHAVDIAPYPLDWNDIKKFEAIADAMFQASKELGTPIRWGADWDQDGRPREKGETDSPHFELVV